MVYLLALRTNMVRRVTLQEAAELTGLAIEEIQWALEEYGECRTDEFLITNIGE
jgi:predicted HTH domain antitoxin